MSSFAVAPSSQIFIDNKSEIRISDVAALLHSSNENERSDAVWKLGKLCTGEASRELIAHFHECQWRSTQFEILRALQFDTSPRTLGFLFGIASSSVDLPMQREALTSLGKGSSPLGSRYLTALLNKFSGHTAIAVVNALALTQNSGMIPFLKEKLVEVKLSKQSNNRRLQSCLQMNIEKLKGSKVWFAPFAFDLLLEILKWNLTPINSENSHQISATLKLSPNFAETSGNAETGGSAQSAGFAAKNLTESNFASKFVAGEKFTPAKLSKAMGLLRNLTPEDQQKFLILAASNHEQFTREALYEILDFMQSYWGEGCQVFLQASRTRCLKFSASPLFEKWFESLSVCAPNAKEQFEALFASSEFQEWGEEQKIVATNHYINTMQWHSNVDTTTLQKMFREESSHVVKARLIRGFAQLKHQNEDIDAILKTRLGDPRYTLSLLFYLERCQPSGGFALCLDMLSEGLKTHSFSSSWLRAALAQAKVSQGLKFDRSAKLVLFLRRCLSQEAGVTVQVLALRFLTAFPAKEFLKDVLQFLKFDSRLQLSAIVTLKSFPEPQCIPALLSCALESQHLNVIGRVLDTLSVFPEQAILHALKEILEKHGHKIEIVQKIHRILGDTYGLEKNEFLQSDLQEDSLSDTLAQNSLLTTHELCRKLCVILNNSIGKKYLLPSFKARLFQFQNVFDLLGYSARGEMHPSLHLAFEMQQEFLPQDIPIQQLERLGQLIYSGEISTQYKEAFRDLRNWLCLLLMFGKIEGFLECGAESFQINETSGLELQYSENMRNLCHKLIRLLALRDENLNGNAKSNATTQALHLVQEVTFLVETLFPSQEFPQQ